MTHTDVPSAEHIQRLKDELKEARSAVRAEKRRLICRAWYQRHQHSTKEKMRQRYAERTLKTYTCVVCQKTVREHNRAAHDDSARHKVKMAKSVNELSEAQSDV